MQCLFIRCFQLYDVSYNIGSIGRVNLLNLCLLKRSVLHFQSKLGLDWRDAMPVRGIRSYGIGSGKLITITLATLFGCASTIGICIIDFLLITK